MLNYLEIDMGFAYYEDGLKATAVDGEMFAQFLDILVQQQQQWQPLLLDQTHTDVHADYRIKVNR